MFKGGNRQAETCQYDSLYNDLLFNQGYSVDVLKKKKHPGTCIYFKHINQDGFICICIFKVEVADT